MSSPDGEDLVPDQDLLARLFPEANIASHNVISNSWETCTFKAQFQTDLAPSGYPQEVLIRLEKTQKSPSDSLLTVIAALQKLAGLKIPNLVPTIFKVGKTSTHNGIQIAFSVMEFVTETFTLEAVWDEMTESDRISIAAAVAEALHKMQQLRLGDGAVQTALTGTPFIGDDHEKQVFGGPYLGFHSSMACLLKNIIQLQNDTQCSFAIDDNGTVTIQSSAYPDLGIVQISGSELQVLEHASALSHNDIEPRSILVRKTPVDEDGPSYQLAAIIDWEMSSFIPFALEAGLKDTFLGRQNQNFDWYRLFKEHTSSMLLPELHAVHNKLLRAVMLAEQASRQNPGRNVGRAIQKKWFQREKLELSRDPLQGWIRQPNAGIIGPFSKVDNETLETDVLRELGYI